MRMVLWSVWALSVWPAAGAAADTTRYDFERIRMGVLFRLTLYAPDAAAANKAAEAAYHRISQLDAILSDYDPESELMRLSAAAGTGRSVPVSAELFAVLAHAQELSAQSRGAFDMTVGPVVKLWRRARRRKELPDPQRLHDALARVGYQHVRLDPRTRTVTLNQPGMKLDAGGIAKGYAGDEALRVLRAHGITRTMIDASGDIVVGDPPPGRMGWRIGIAPLGAPDAPPSRYLHLANAAVATSGDVFQFVEIGGVRYSHIVDPHTGLGLKGRSSVTVIAPTGIAADGLASAVSVLGPVEGLELIESQAGVAGMIVVADDGTIQTHVSRRFAAFEIRDEADRPE